MADSLIPKLPSLKDLTESEQSPSYGNVMSLITKSGQVPGVTETVMPSIVNLLSPGGQGVSPFVADIEERTRQNVAKTQSNMMRRGLTGSDIEMAGMRAAEAGGERAISQFYGATANTLADALLQTATGDINVHRQTLLALAQAMGQKIQSDQELKMFQESLAASLRIAKGNQMASLIGAGIGAVGSIGSAAAMPGI